MSPAAGAQRKSPDPGAVIPAPAALPSYPGEPGSAIWCAAVLLDVCGVETARRYWLGLDARSDEIRRARQAASDQPRDRAIDWSKYDLPQRD